MSKIPGEAHPTAAELLLRLTALQTQLGAYWGEVLAGTARRLAERGAGLPTEPVDPAALKRSGKLWVDCAEEAYAEVVRRAGFAQTQAGLINASLALFLDKPPVSDLTAQPAGVQVGCTAREAVWGRGNLTLYRYLPLPLAQPRSARPLLICFALVNRPWVLDLQPDRSLVRALLGAGHALYVIDWGDPDGANTRTLAEYVEGDLGGCVEFLRRAHGTRAVDLLGVCQGGTLSLCYSALHPHSVANLITITPPVDFHTAEDLLSLWVRELDTSLLARVKRVPGALLNALFLSLRPYQLTVGKYLGLADRLHEPRALHEFVRMESWIGDNPDQEAVALAQFVQWFYQENRLIRGTLELAGRPVRLGKIVQPVLNIYATRDHIVPARSSAALGEHLGSRDYTAHPVPGGHIGIYTSRTAYENTAARLRSWLAARR